MYYFSHSLKLVSTDMIKTISWIAEKKIYRAQRLFAI